MPRPSPAYSLNNNKEKGKKEREMPKKSIGSKVYTTWKRSCWGRSSFKAWIFDPFTIGIWLFGLFIAVPILMAIGTSVTSSTVQNTPGLNASQKLVITNYSANVFLNSPDIVMATMYFILLLASFIAASYEGADPAVTLLIGFFFIIVAEIVSFGISDVAHSYISQVYYLNISKHLPITTYIMNYLPYFNGLLTIMYMLFVITKRQIIVERFAGGWSGGGGNIVSQ
jgi:hypothetical protein